VILVNAKSLFCTFCDMKETVKEEGLEWEKEEGYVECVAK
jgi:hypothetical protein